MHTPVLLKEVIKFLDPKPGEFIVDGTIDGGGHAVVILKKIGTKGKLLGIDWDVEILANCKERMANRKNLILVHGNYAELPKILKERNLPKANGLLLDLGFSSEQLENACRGFSFRKDESLLMTYDQNLKPVKQILKELNAKDIAKIIFEFSGEKFAMPIARAIKEYQRRQSIETSMTLAGIIREAVPKNYEHGRIDPATRTFQALRIYANNELENLQIVLNNLSEILRPGGRVVVNSFHSLEDRVVKQGFRDIEKTGQIEILTKKSVVASEEEIRENPRSRSAKLRAAQMTTDS